MIPSEPFVIWCVENVILPPSINASQPEDQKPFSLSIVINTLEFGLPNGRECTTGHQNIFQKIFVKYPPGTADSTNTNPELVLKLNNK